MARLLLAEDEPVLRMLIVDTLEDEGHQIDAAFDGQEALDRLSANTYDLVILDNMMPRMTGLEVIAAVRSIPESAGIRILLLSAKNRSEDMAPGADGFMSKPFSPRELAAKVEELLNG